MAELRGALLLSRARQASNVARPYLAGSAFARIPTVQALERRRMREGIWLVLDRLITSFKR